MQSELFVYKMNCYYTALRTITCRKSPPNHQFTCLLCLRKIVIFRQFAIISWILFPPHVWQGGCKDFVPLNAAAMGRFHSQSLSNHFSKVLMLILLKVFNSCHMLCGFFAMFANTIQMCVQREGGGLQFDWQAALLLTSSSSWCTLEARVTHYHNV